jgi:WD40 repeat protein
MQNRISGFTSWLCTLTLVFGLQSATCGQGIAKEESNSGKEPFSQWENANLIQTLEAHSEEINLLELSPDGRFLVSVEPSAIAIWSVETGELLRILPGHYGTEIQMNIAPTDVSFSPDGKFLASATWSQDTLTPEKSILVWEIETGEQVLSLKGETGCRQILFSPDGNQLYGACGLGVQVWDFPSGDKLFNFDTDYPNEAIALSPDATIMATADANVTGGQQGEASNQIQLWSLNEEGATLLNTLSGHNNDIAQLAFNHNGKKLISSSYDGAIKVWNWQTGKEYPFLPLNSENGLFSIGTSDRFIAGQFPNGAIADLVTGFPLQISAFPSKLGQPSMVALSPQEDILAWAGQPSTYANPAIFLWQTGKDELPPDSSNERNNYEPLALNKFWTNNPNQKLAFAIGTNPQEIALSALGLTETVESEQEQVNLAYTEENLAIATITQTHLTDDSIFGIRYRVEFAPYGEAKQEKWRVIWAGKQYKCQSDRGHQDWSSDLCQ